MPWQTMAGWWREAVEWLQYGSVVAPMLMMSQITKEKTMERRKSYTLSNIIGAILIAVASGVFSAWATVPIALARHEEKFVAVNVRVDKVGARVDRAESDMYRALAAHATQQNEDMRELKASVALIHQCLMNRTCGR